MKILVCGAGGMLGRDLVAAAGLAGHQVVALDRQDLDVTDGAAVADAVVHERPSAVVNCAAYTDVDGAEQEADQALRVNAQGAANVAGAARRTGAVVVYPSTDYVFDGTKAEPYVESDVPHPLSSYGRSKLGGERETASANPRHLVIRSSWLFGRGGRNFVETMLELGRRGEVTVVHDQMGCPTYTAHLAQGILRLLDSEVYGIHHMAGGGGCSWFEFAHEIFRQAHMRVRVRPTTSDRMGRPAMRPEYSVLRSERPEAVQLPHWKMGLEAYMAERRVAA